MHSTFPLRLAFLKREIVLVERLIAAIRVQPDTESEPDQVDFLLQNPLHPWVFRSAADSLDRCFSSPKGNSD